VTSTSREHCSRLQQSRCHAVTFAVYKIAASRGGDLDY